MKRLSPTRSFAASFTSEDHLRQCLRILFSKIPSVRGVQITHGSQELGKDIIFYVPNFLGTPELYACVVKKTKIDGSVSKTGAREVLTQALQAFDSPHINTEGQEEAVSKVFIISPYDCPIQTMSSIKGALKARAGQVQFLCGQLLMDEFAKYWQDFLLFESSALNTYVASLARHLIDKDPIHFILKAQQLLGGELESLESRYIDQELKKTLNVFGLTFDHTILAPDGFAGLLTQADIRAKTTQLVSLANLFESRTLVAGLNEQDHLLRTKHTPSIEVQRRSVAASKKVTNVDHSNEAIFTLPLTSFEQQEIVLTLKERTLELQEEWQELRKAASAKVQTLRAKNPWEASQISLGAFRLSGHWHERYHNQLTSAIDLIKYLELLVEGTSNFVKACKRDGEALSNRHFSAFSYLDDIAREAPGFISKMSQLHELAIKRSTLLQNSRANLLITAPAGYGKTSFCKIHAVRDAVSLSEKQSKVIPVYVALSGFATAAITDDNLLINLPELSGIMNQGDPTKMQWVFYLDGLDEIADPAQRQQVMVCARKVIEKLPQARIIVTSRNYVSGPELAWLTRVELGELDEENLFLLAGKWLTEKNAVALFKEQLGTSPALSRLCRVPLIATLTLAVFKKDPSLPRNKAALYKTFTELLCGGWDYVKGVNRDSHYGRHDKLRILVRFAGLLHMDRRTSGTERDLRRAVADVHSELLPTFNRLREELVEDGLVQWAGRELVFSHLSFQEYLASLEFGDPSGERSNALLLSFLRGDNWWSEVLAFYVAGPNRPDEMERWIRAGSKRLQGTLFSDGSREKFLMVAIEEAFPGWKPSQ